MGKAVSQPSGGPTWTSGQAYALALVCLGVGLLAGWFFRGSAQAPAAAPQTVAQGQEQHNHPEGPAPVAVVNEQAAPLLDALKRNPRDAQTLISLGNLYYDSQHYPQAIEYYGKALEITPNNHDVRTDMGTAMYYSGDADKAIEQYQRVLKADPNHANSLMNLGVVKWQGKLDPKGAIAVWESFLQRHPNHPNKQRVVDLMNRARQHSDIPGFPGKG